MEYSLAKELKEAGFPHKCSMIGGNDGDSEYCFYQEWYVNDGFYCVPTLLELVEACKDIRLILALSSEGKFWQASGWISNTEYKIIAKDSPDEAVAHLWLKINAQPSR